MTALFAALQILSNHVQMSYYFAFLILCIIIGYFVEALRNKALRSFLIASLVTLFSGLIAIGINGSNLYHTYEYGQETIRGGSELTPLPNAEGQQVQATSEGLDKDYITAWSYGKGETFTLLIPNLYGGASGALGENPANLEDHRWYEPLLGRSALHRWSSICRSLRLLPLHRRCHPCKRGSEVVSLSWHGAVHCPGLGAQYDVVHRPLH